LLSLPFSDIKYFQVRLVANNKKKSRLILSMTPADQGLDPRSSRRHVRLELFIAACVVAIAAAALAVAAWLPQFDSVADAQAENGALEELRISVAAGEFERAIPALRRLAEQGEPAAQRLLGEMYRAGTGVELDINQSFRWLLAAAERGDADSQGDVAEMYAHGYGVQQDLAKASEWAARAAHSTRGDSTRPIDSR
jgi:hypothetical protein